MTKSKILFEEKQYLGHNRFSIVVRAVLTLFCFVGYYWSENPKPVKVSFIHIGSYPISEFSNSGLIFFILGLSIVVLSAMLTYVLHMHIQVTETKVMLHGFWTSRHIVLDLSDIAAIRKSRYKRNIWKRVAYNLHNKGLVRFYTSGQDFIELVDNKGYTYRIGTQHAEQLHFILQSNLKKINKNSF